MRMEKKLQIEALYVGTNTVLVYTHNKHQRSQRSRHYLSNNLLIQIITNPNLSILYLTPQSPYNLRDVAKRE